MSTIFKNIKSETSLYNNSPESVESRNVTASPLELKFTSEKSISSEEKDELLEEYTNQIGFEGYIAQLVNEKLLKYIEWTEKECGWLRLKDESLMQVDDVTLGSKIKEIFKESFAGDMIYYLNRQQPSGVDFMEKKLNIIDHVLRNNEFPSTYERLNLFVDDVINLLKRCIQSNSNGIITIKSLLSNLSLLRFPNCQISAVDNYLRKYDNIQALILASNYIKDFPGYYLPRNLKMLELYGNILGKIELLCTDAPTLLYLGIGRNYLNENSRLISLFPLSYICHLDLSDNDLMNLTGLIKILSSLLRLESLELIGNPCSLSMNYKHIVQYHLPTLKYLDGESLEVSQPRKVDSNSGGAVLQLYAIRIMGLLNDENNVKIIKKKTSHYLYRFEIDLPLLDEDLKNWEWQRTVLEVTGEHAEEEITEIQDLKKTRLIEKLLFIEEQLNSLTNEKINDDKKTTKMQNKKKQNDVDNHKKKHNKKNNDKHNNKKKQNYDKNDEEKEKKMKQIIDKYNNYLSRDIPLPVQTKFISEEFAGSDFIEQKHPIIEVPVEMKSLMKLRNTLRSVATVRLIAIEREEMKKDSRNKKTRKSKIIKNKIMINNEKEDENKITIAKILVPLQMVKWNEEFVGYMWNIKHCLARPYPNIQDLKYKTHHKKTKHETSDHNTKTYKEVSPYLTCHFGIGLKRLPTYAPPETKIEKKEIEKKEILNKQHKKHGKRYNQEEIQSDDVNRIRSIFQNLKTTKCERMEDVFISFFENLNKKFKKIEGGSNYSLKRKGAHRGHQKK